MCIRTKWLILASAFLLLALPAFAADHDAVDDGGKGPSVAVDGLSFESWEDYARSDYFKASGKRCGTPTPELRQALYQFPDFFALPEGGGGADCSAGSTNPTGDYDPTVLYRIPVVVHILMDDSCTQGVISDALVQTQIDILNEDFLALAGTNGANGTDAQIEFYLATVDPQGNPTTGITRDCNTTWFNDGGGYWNSLAWDPNNYLNFYTNQAGGSLGYVPFLPADGGGSFVGTPQDRVVVLWDTFGRNAPFGPPYDQGRTGTHELGHYFGLEHVFSGGCGNPAQCYTTGDLICDTEPDQTSHFGCPNGATSCGGERVPIENYMEYTDDLCMEAFTTEQMRRMRCSLEFYRPDLAEIGTVAGLFEDGFEAGDTTAWSNALP